MSKNRFIVKAVLAGQTHGWAARPYGIATVWLGKLVARWRAGGRDAVEMETTCPRPNPNATGDDTVALIVTRFMGCDCWTKKPERGTLRRTRRPS
jgi:hypothetical protein